MMAERSLISTDDCTEKPSPIWSEALGAFKYLLNLPTEDFQNIRFHTELIDRGSMWRYWAPYPKLDPEAEARDLGYLSAIETIPQEYWLSEPPLPCMPRPLGVNFQGHVVNPNIVRYQTCVANLYLAGAFQFIDDSQNKQIVVEIGGGSGGLAHGMINILGGKVTYVLIDLPEMLLLQGAFVALHNPAKAVYVYDKATFTRDFVSSEIFDFDVVLIPNYVVDRLKNLRDIAIFINMQSFQEMSEQQIRSYLGLARDKLSYCIYSDNIDRHPYNENQFLLSHLLREYFDLYPDPEFYEKLYKGMDPFSYDSYKRYFGFGEGVRRTDRNMIEKILVKGTRKADEALAVAKAKRLVSMIPGMKHVSRVARLAMGS
ncbi:MAG TPA: putative sugar O-methyltransferase [Desulfomonilaceae bacterium]|nr:putative sugar O-methyltransferase [Desulfomonilaceae bacterium]